MQNFVKSISDKAEFIIVVLIAFGYFILASILYLLYPVTNSSINQAGLISLIIYEIIIFAFVWTFLAMREWNFNMLGFNPGIKDTIVGLLLAPLLYGIYWAILNLTVLVFPALESSIMNTNIIESDISIITVVLVSIINPIFEELFVCAYVIESLKNIKGISFAINVSILLRILYHLYQGIPGLILIIPLGILFSFWYAKTKRLWPIIVVHGIFDFIGFFTYL